MNETRKLQKMNEKINIFITFDYFNHFHSNKKNQKYIFLLNDFSAGIKCSMLKFIWLILTE